MRRLRYDNESINKVSRLVRWHNYCPELIKKEVRKGIYKIGEDIFPFLFSIKRVKVAWSGISNPVQL